MGKLIVLEAVDDEVLDELAERLSRWLAACGIDAECTREPTYGPAGTQVLLAEQERLELDAMSLALLYLADRLDHVERAEGLASWLDRGQHVICAHYGLAAAARLWGEVDWAWMERIDALSRKPDLTLFVDLPVDIESKRLQASYRAVVERLCSDSDVRTIHSTEPQTAFLACQRAIAHMLDLECDKVDPGDISV
jgi:dTMP kinase